MINTEKKKRGRPKKDNKEINIVNEEKEVIKMTNDNVDPIGDNVNQYKMEQIGQKLGSIFTKYQGRELTYNDYQNAMSSAYINNPFIQNQRIKNINSPAMNNNKTDLGTAVNNPMNSESLLRGESQSLFFSNYVYKNILKINRETPEYFNYVLPHMVSKKDMQSEEFQKENQFVNLWLDRFDVKRVLKDITLSVSVEGKCSYVYRDSWKKAKNKTDNSVVDFCLLEKIPSHWIKYTSIGSTTPYITSLNFMMFMQPGFSVEQYPPFFKEIWDELHENEIIKKDKKTNIEMLNPNAKINPNHMLEYSNNSYMYWVELPQNLVFEFGEDNSHALQIPEYIGLFTDLKGLSNYKWLQEQLMTKPINSILSGTIPLTKDPQPGADSTAISVDSIMGFTEIVSNAIPGNTFPFFTPFTDIKLHTVPFVPEAKEINTIALKNLINSSGNGALLSTTDKPSIISVKTAQMLTESKANYLTLQFQSCMNFIINKHLDLKYRYKLDLWGNTFTFREDIKIYKELIMNGVTTVLPRLLSAFNCSLEQGKCINDYLDVLGIYDGFKPMSTINKDITGETKKVGRPTIPVDQLENDSTGISQDTGDNVSDTKQFTGSIRNLSTSESNEDNTTCVICGENISEDEEYICDDCLQEQYDNRLEELQSQLKEGK